MGICAGLLLRGLALPSPGMAQALLLQPDRLPDPTGLVPASASVKDGLVTVTEPRLPLRWERCSQADT